MQPRWSRRPTPRRWPWTAATDGRTPPYTRLRAALRGRPPVCRPAVFRSSSPCRLDVLELLCAIDTTAAGWEPHGKGTIERLHQLAGRGWRPQDCDLIGGYCDRMQRWVVSAAELLGGEPRVP